MTLGPVVAFVACQKPSGFCLRIAVDRHRRRQTQFHRNCLAAVADHLVVAYHLVVAVLFVAVRPVAVVRLSVAVLFAVVHCTVVGHLQKMHHFLVKQLVDHPASVAVVLSVAVHLAVFVHLSVVVRLSVAVHLSAVVLFAVVRCTVVGRLQKIRHFLGNLLVDHLASVVAVLFAVVHLAASAVLPVAVLFAVGLPAAVVAGLFVLEPKTIQFRMPEVVLRTQSCLLLSDLRKASELCPAAAGLKPLTSASDPGLLIGILWLVAEHFAVALQALEWLFQVPVYPAVVYLGIGWQFAVFRVPVSAEVDHHPDPMDPVLHLPKKAWD